ncbi:4-demethylwyosine synthase TYW1 [Candidatus Pacearchaeota archaeon]|nr:4-demethylwyosine synthase TYW1 [Candidatus Pacearchaeota archaeon]
MLSKRLKETLKKQHYGIVGKHSLVDVCEWTKNSLRGRGECYKQKFYGIKSHRCCEVSPSAFCQNKCIHCWRAIELSENRKISLKECDNPGDLIDGFVKERKKLLIGFNGNPNTEKSKLREAFEPEHFAISLIGEPTLYPKLGEMIKELRKRKKTSFIVTNGLQPEVLKKLSKQKALPTQLYVSMNAGNKELYDKWHRSYEKNAWKKYNKTLKLLRKLKTRKVIRMTIVKDLNMANKDAKEFAVLIKKAMPDFVEVKSFMSVGYARQRMGYEKMPSYREIKDFAKVLAKEIGNKYKVLNEHVGSRIVLIGKSKYRMKIKKKEI